MEDAIQKVVAEIVRWANYYLGVSIPHWLHTGSWYQGTMVLILVGEKIISNLIFVL